MALIDADAHLHAEGFGADLAAVLAAAGSAEIRAMLVVSGAVADTLADVMTENARRLFSASPGRHSHDR